jgi:hypothetical protein
VLQDKQAEHADFKEQIECRDAAIFMSIPALLVYLAAAQADTSAEVCERFLPEKTELKKLACEFAKVLNEAT